MLVFALAGLVAVFVKICLGLRKIDDRYEFF